MYQTREEDTGKIGSLSTEPEGVVCTLLAARTPHKSSAHTHTKKGARTQRNEKNTSRHHFRFQVEQGEQRASMYEGISSGRFGLIDNDRGFSCRCAEIPSLTWMGPRIKHKNKRQFGEGQYGEQDGLLPLLKPSKAHGSVTGSQVLASPRTKKEICAIC